jgi:hypothetical protein
MKRFIPVAALGSLLACLAAVARDDPPPADTDTTLIGDQARAVRDTVKQNAKEAADAVREGAQTAATRAKEVGSDVASKAKQVGSDVATSAKEGAHEVAATTRKGARKVKSTVSGEKSPPAAPAPEPDKPATP